MDRHSFPASDLPGTTKLFSAYLNEFEKVERFYAHAPEIGNALTAAKAVNLPAATRAVVVDVLRKQNQEFGGDASVFTNLAHLAGGAFAVVTGQQAGLLTGPAYSIYKAVTAIELARRVSQMGAPAVPVFWIAAEDHDLAEVQQTHWLTVQGLHGLRLEATAHAHGKRVGDVTLGPGAADLVRRAVELLEGAEVDFVQGIIAESVGPEETYATSFAKLMARIFAGRGLILLDPRAPELHHAAASAYRQALQDAARLNEKLIARGRELERSGLHVQVKVTEASTLLFMQVDGKRMALRRRSEKFVCGGLSMSEADLLARLDAQPELFSPNALFRAVVQDSLLPTVAYVGGPAEIAYFAQSATLYEEILGRMPVVLPRAGFSLVEPHVGRLLERYGISVQDVMAGQTRLRQALERKSLPDGLAKQFALGEKQVAQFLKKVSRSVVKLDRTLVGAAATADRKMLYQLRKLRDKTARAHAFRAGVVARHEGVLLNALFPHKQPAERVLNFLPFLARAGKAALEELETLAGDTGKHHVVFL